MFYKFLSKFQLKPGSNADSVAKKTIQIPLSILILESGAIDGCDETSHSFMLERSVPAHTCSDP
jgi:hypothetical protein